jgi:hypothetical protein
MKGSRSCRTQNGFCKIAQELKKKFPAGSFRFVKLRSTNKTEYILPIKEQYVDKFAQFVDDLLPTTLTHDTFSGRSLKNSKQQSSRSQSQVPSKADF